MTSSRVRTVRPDCMSSATSTPSRAPSSTWSVTIAVASGRFSFSPRARRRRASSAAEGGSSRSCSWGDRCTADGPPDDGGNRTLAAVCDSTVAALGDAGGAHQARLLDADAESLRGSAVTVTGPRAAVDAFAARHELLHSDSLGGHSRAVVRLSEATDGTDAAAARLSWEPTKLQQLVVALSLHTAPAATTDDLEEVPR